MEVVTFNDFEKLEFLSGTIVKAEEFPRARNPSYKIWVDFGSAVGILQTSAQVTAHYTIEQLTGKAVVGCVNLGKRNIAGFVSEFLLVGFKDANNDVVLIAPDLHVPKGQKLC
jgi:tRNA-binding protein